MQSIFDTPRAAQFVLSLLARTPGTGPAQAQRWTQEQWQTMLNHQANVSLTGIVRHICSVHAIDLPRSVSHMLKLQYAGLVMRYEHILETQQATLQRMVDTGIPVAVFKGTPLAQTLYPSPELRIQHDIDLVVNPSDFDVASQVLLENGWRGGRHQSLHCVFSRDNDLIELHRGLFGQGESVLFNYTDDDTRKFIDGSLNRAEQAVLLLLKLFSETVFSPLKLCDIFSLFADETLDCGAVAKEYRRRDAAFACTVIGSTVAAYDHQFRGPRFAVWGDAALRFQRTWSWVQYPMLLATTRNRLRKAFRIASTSESWNDPERATPRERIRGLARTFFGTRYRAAAPSREQTA